MQLYLDEFIVGVCAGLQKQAATPFEATTNYSIFPVIDSQQVWKFSNKDGHLELNTGDVVHRFETPNGIPSTGDFPLKKVQDGGFHSFTPTGTAQVHRGNPGMLYITLHNGATNPTYTLHHENGDNWRAVHKQKQAEVIEVDPGEFLGGLLDKSASMIDPVLHGADWLFRKGKNVAMLPGLHSPLSMGLLGAGIGAAYDLGKRTFYNSPEENKEEGFLQRAGRYALPALGMAGISAGEKSLFPKYYNTYPLYEQ